MYSARAASGTRRLLPILRDTISPVSSSEYSELRAMESRRAASCGVSRSGLLSISPQFWLVGGADERLRFQPQVANGFSLCVYTQRPLDEFMDNASDGEKLKLGTVKVICRLAFVEDAARVYEESSKAELGVTVLFVNPRSPPGGVGAFAGRGRWLALQRARGTHEMPSPGVTKETKDTKEASLNSFNSSNSYSPRPIILHSIPSLADPLFRPPETQPSLPLRVC